MTFVKSIQTTPTIINPETFAQNKGLKIILDVQKMKKAFALGDEDDVIFDILKAIHAIQNDLCKDDGNYIAFPNLTKKMYFKQYLVKFNK